MRTHLAAALTAALTLTAGTTATAAPPPTTASCGQTLTHSVTLAGDLTNCPDAGLIVGADGITINLNGHTVDGVTTPAEDCDAVDPGGPAGIDNNTGHDDVTIENGTVQQFANGFTADSESDGMVDSRLHDLTLRDNRFSGIDIGAPGRLHRGDVIEHDVASGNQCGFGVALSGVHASQITHNQVVDNALGIVLCCSDHNVIAHNRVAGTRHDALIVCCADDAYNVIRDNTVTHSDESGIVLCCSDGQQHNVVTRNAVSHSLHSGILLEGASGNDVAANHVFADGDGISFDGNRNAITDNHVSGGPLCSDDACAGLGIGSDGGRDNLIARNDVSRTTGDGIRIESFAVYGAPPSLDNVVRDNRVRDAGRDGVSVGTEVAGPISGLLLEDNSARRSADDGFDVRDPDTMLRRDVAFHSADLGIDAVAGVTDGGGNRAFANGNPLQCTNVLCSGR